MPEGPFLYFFLGSDRSWKN